MSFHLAIAAAWALVVLVGARGHGANLWPAVRSAVLAGAIALGLSLGAATLLPDPVDCYEQTPTGRGSC